jgi:hypothetical protein
VNSTQCGSSGGCGGPDGLYQLSFLTRNGRVINPRSVNGSYEIGYNIIGTGVAGTREVSALTGYSVGTVDTIGLVIAGDSTAPTRTGIIDGKTGANIVMGYVVVGGVDLTFIYGILTGPGTGYAIYNRGSTLDRALYKISGGTMTPFLTPDGRQYIGTTSNQIQMLNVSSSVEGDLIITDGNGFNVYVLKNGDTTWSLLVDSNTGQPLPSVLNAKYYNDVPDGTPSYHSWWNVSYVDTSPTGANLFFNGSISGARYPIDVLDPNGIFDVSDYSLYGDNTTGVRGGYMMLIARDFTTGLYNLWMGASGTLYKQQGYVSGFTKVLGLRNGAYIHHNKSCI